MMTKTAIESLYTSRNSNDTTIMRTISPTKNISKLVAIKRMLAIMLLVTLLVTGCIQPPEIQENGESEAQNQSLTNEYSPPVTSSEKNNERNYRQDMRDFIENISFWAREFNSDFIIIPQNGSELLTENGEETGVPAVSYLDAIDGVGREELFYGYYDDDAATPVSECDRMIAFMDIAESNGIEVLTTDYCSTPSFVDDSYYQNTTRGYISFAADHRELDNIPGYPINPFNMNSVSITSLTEAQNFLYLINPSSYSSKIEFLKAIKNTSYDIVIIDPFYDSDILTENDVTSLKVKANNGTRLVIAYMSIGEAEDYRYYWRNDWKDSPPSWLAEENPDWPGNYKVLYWNPRWHEIIYGNDNSYLKKIIDAGFDGVYLDIIDAFEYYENK